MYWQGCCSLKKSLQKCQQRTAALGVLMLEQNSRQVSLMEPLSFLLCPASLARYYTKRLFRKAEVLSSRKRKRVSLLFLVCLFMIWVVVGGACEICFLYFLITKYSANKDSTRFTPPWIKLLAFTLTVFEGKWELCLHRPYLCCFLSLSRCVQNLRPVKFCEYHTSFLSPWPLCL